MCGYRYGYKTVDNKDYLFAKTGNETTAHSTGINAMEWIKEVQDLAGEVVINSMNKDGMRNGYDIKLLKKLSSVCNLPMIASEVLAVRKILLMFLKKQM